VVRFTEIWTAHCAPLPRLLKPPSRPMTPQHDLNWIAEVWRLVEGDADLLADAIELAAADPKYRECKYGWVTFCRHAGERWIGAAQDRRKPRVIEMPPSVEDGDAYSASFAVTGRHAG
jgi:hypothetical protein